MLVALLCVLSSCHRISTPQYSTFKTANTNTMKTRCRYILDTTSIIQDKQVFVFCQKGLTLLLDKIRLEDGVRTLRNFQWPKDSSNLQAIPTTHSEVLLQTYVNRREDNLDNPFDTYVARFSKEGIMLWHKIVTMPVIFLSEENSSNRFRAYLFQGLKYMSFISFRLSPQEKNSTLLDTYSVSTNLVFSRAGRASTHADEMYYLGTNWINQDSAYSTEENKIKIYKLNLKDFNSKEIVDLSKVMLHYFSYLHQGNQVIDISFRPISIFTMQNDENIIGQVCIDGVLSNPIVRRLQKNLCLLFVFTISTKNIALSVIDETLTLIGNNSNQLFFLSVNGEVQVHNILR